MSAFLAALRDKQADRRYSRRWLYVPYDQLHDGIGPLADEPVDELGIVLIESRAKGERRSVFCCR